MALEVTCAEWSDSCISSYDYTNVDHWNVICIFIARSSYPYKADTHRRLSLSYTRIMQSKW